jgi:choline kinase
VQVVLLAAGLGSRLGPLTSELPKALIRVGGEPLLFHALRFAARLDPSRVVVVGGFGHRLVARELEAGRASDPTLARLPISLLENTAFRDGNLVSLMTARPLVDGGFLLLNVDHVYRPSIAPLVAEPTGEITAFVDTDRVLGDDDMKVLRDGTGRIRQISKRLEAWDCGYVGMTRVPGDALARYFAEAERALAEEGRAIHVERVLGRLAETDRPPACRDVSGHGWLEVDLPEERDRAEEALRGPGWR